MNATCKKLLSLAMVLAMVLTMTPVISVPAAATTTNYASPVGDIVAAQSGAVKCDACKQDISWDDWTPITMETLGCAQMFDTATTFALQPGTHYYLAEDIIAYTATQVPFLTVTAGDPICLHLNGKTIRNVKNQADLDAPGANVAENIEVGETGTGTVIDANAGTVNLMGEGYVACRENNSPNAVVTINGGAVNVYGGTYNNHRNARACITIGKSGGSLAVYGGIFQDPLGIRGGSSNTAGAIAVHGGELTARCLFESSNTSPLAAGTQLTVTGGTFQLATSIMEDGMDLTIKPVITGGSFNIDPKGYLGDCVAAVKTDSVWTVEEKHNYGGDGVCADCGDVADGVPAFNPEGNEGKAYCEACYRQALAAGKSREDALEAALKDWVLLTSDSSDTNGNMIGSSYSGHYYLKENFVATKKRAARVYNAAKVCLNLNGCVLTKAADAAEGPVLAVGKDAGSSSTPTLNIMDSVGTGMIVGRSSGANAAGMALSVDRGVCNIYGGTLRRLNTTTGQRVVVVGAGATLNFYDGTIDGRLYDANNINSLAANQVSSRSGMAVLVIGAAEDNKAVFNMYSGTVIGGTLKNDASNEGAAAIQVGYGSNGYSEFNLSGGTISGGINNSDNATSDDLNGGNLGVHKNAVVNMSGGMIYGGTSGNGGNVFLNGTFYMTAGKIYGGTAGTIDGTSYGNGGNLYVGTDGTFNMSGGEVYGTAYEPDAATAAYDAKSGGNIYIYGGGEVNLSGTAVVRDGAASSQAGNIYLSSTARLNMSGSAEVRDGVAATRGGNIRAYTDTGNTTRPVITMAGNSKVYGGFAARLNSEGVLQSNNEHNIWIGNGDLIMKDNATIHGLVREDGVIAEKSAVALTSGSRLVLDGNASIVNQTGTSSQIADIGATDTLIVTKDWKGTVYLNSCTVDAETGKITGPVASCGTFNYETLEATKDETATGTFTGTLYYYNNGNSPVLGIRGDLCSGAFSVVTANSEKMFPSAAAALEELATLENAYLKAYADMTLNLTDDVYVDINGKAVTVTGSGKLYAMNSLGEDYVSATTLTVANTVDIVRDVTNPVTGKRYINITTDKGEGVQTITSYSLEMKLDTVTLRAATNEGMGLYYKVKLSMSPALANNVDTYGVVLSLANMPGADFMTDRNAQGANENGFTAMENIIPVSTENGYTVTLNSGSVFGIMKENTAMAAANAQRGKMPIYANAYLEIDADRDGVSEFYMAVNDGEIAWSLYDVLATIDGRWSDFTAAHEKVTAFYSHWAQYGMDAWKTDLPNIAG